MATRSSRLWTRIAAALWFVMGASVLHAQTTYTPADMVLTKHNLSVSGTGSIRALTETRICVFCHTPHNSTPLTPLWNRELQPRNYTVYSSPTLKADPLPQPSGPTKLCLTCHDGMVAMGGVLNPSGGIAMAGNDMLPPGSLSNFGLDLSGHHPVSFSYHTSLPNDELAPTPPLDLNFGGADELHCMTCHDPHNDTYGKFLAKDNRYSTLCITCHQIDGWSTSLHATSTSSVVGLLPRPPKTWPTYTQMNEWGCEVCHTPHFAPTAEGLLNFTSNPPNPFTCTEAQCHGAQPSPAHRLRTTSTGQVVTTSTDIARQTRKISAHRQDLGVETKMTRRRKSSAGVRSAACVDCHSPHQLTELDAEAPYASGLLHGASGVDRYGADVDSVTFEYEVCFKCHGDNAPDLNYVPRVLPSTNLRLAFDPSNPSYHPVVAMGRNFEIPSIPSALEPDLSPASQMYCSTCHADDEGQQRGPHGSAYAPILKERYETTDNTTESREVYALCYRCHERDQILSDTSFRAKSMRATPSGGGHRGHLAAGAPCSACHDPHGVTDAGGMMPGATGAHSHLINFDTRIVTAKPGESFPRFTDNGSFAGTCTLVCHGVTHDNASYP